MRYLACCCLSLAAGCCAYAIGAVAWSAVDPQGAGAKLLFTIPVALVGMAVPGIFGMLCIVFRGAFVPEPKRAASTPVSPVVRTRPPPRPQTRPQTPVDEEELELALAT